MPNKPHWYKLQCLFYYRKTAALQRREEDGIIMKKNDDIQLEIVDMSVDGSGIGKLTDAAGRDGNAMTFFVKDALVGDKIWARITKLKKTYGYARLIEVMEPSPDRVQPPCPVYRKCGGCQIQALSYEKQLEYKQNKIRNNLVRIGGFDASWLPLEPIIGMQHGFRYRNKAQLPIGRDKTGKLTAGFYAARTHSIIPIDDCLLGVSQNQEVVAAILDWMERYQIEPYDEKTGSGLVRHVLVRYGFRSKQLMVCLVVNGGFVPKAAELTGQLAKINGMTSISLNVNKRQDNVIMGDTVKILWGADHIEDFIGDVKFQISPLSFYQVNPVQTEVLYGKVLEFAGLTGKEVVWDLYCGIGTISLFLAQRAKKVFGIEIVPQAIEDARRNARINGIQNAEFFVGEAEDVLEKVCGCGNGMQKEIGVMGEGSGTEDWRPQVVVVDPPRKGCAEKLLEAILRVMPERVVYVSCDSATLARDLKVLCAGGYEMVRGQGVDMFCQTVHVETVVMLSHKKPDSVINVKVKFGEGEGKVPLDNIAKRASAYKPKERVTYKMIKEYIEAKYGFKIHTAYIAEVKRELGLPMYDAPNAVEELKQPRKHPTAEKAEAIKDALKHFEVI